MALNGLDPRCAAVREVLPALVHDDLDGAAAAEARAHLLACFACARELGAALRAARVLATAARPELPQGEESFFATLEADIHARIAGAAHVPERSRALQLLRGASGFLLRRRAALAMAALFLGGLGLVRWMQPIEPRLLGNDPLAVPLRAGGTAFAQPEALENLSRISVRPRPQGVPRFGLEARADLERWLPGCRPARSETPAGPASRATR